MRWVGVGHRNQCRVTTLCTRTASGFDCFGIFASWLAQVRMQVDKARKYVTTSCIKRDIACQIFANLHDDVIVNEHIGFFDTAHPNDTPTLDHNRHDSSSAESKSNSTAIRTDTPFVTCR